MKAEIISIGDELLIGQTVNTNATWLGEKLNEIGVRVHRGITISDDREEIMRVLDEASSRSQVVILTGGLGPTKDDITKLTLCEYFNTSLKVNEEAKERITGFFKSRGLPMLELNTKQAELPEACTVIQNYRGTACGMWFEKNGVVFVSMPGVPYEMHGMMEEVAFPMIQKHFDCPVIKHRTLLTVGYGESFIAQKIEQWENSLEKENIKLAYLPSPGMVKLRMSCYGGDPKHQDEAILRKEKELREIIGESIFGSGKETVAGVVGELLRSRHESLAVAESCTGGFLSHLITSESGSSDYFMGGIVSYAVSAKTNLLQVDPMLIQEHNVVSTQVAAAMAQGVRAKFGSTYGFSTTGIAGPSGGTEDIPVGTVCIALATPEKVISEQFKFGKRREFNIEMAANTALNMLRKEILNIGR